MDMTTIVVVAILACVVVAAFLVFRSKANVKVQGPMGLGVEIDASNPTPASPPEPAVRVKGVKSRGGGLIAEDGTGRGADVQDVETQDDILVSSTPPKDAPPKV